MRGQQELSGTRLEGDSSTTVLDIQDRTEAQGEQGLLGATYSPDGSKLYVHYTDNDGNSVVEEYAMRPDGTGLGLSIAARIVEKHGGALQYQTQVQRGTTFGIVLPRA